MRSLHTIRSVAAPLPVPDIDTDAILPAQFLLLIERAGIGKYLFNHLRRRDAESEPFVLDQQDYQSASIIIAGPRFGIGSSREQAVWALADAGIECIIAPSFGDIFYANCFNNGILPIVLDGEPYERILAASEQAGEITIELETLQIKIDAVQPIAFDLPAHRQKSLMLGLDEIETILNEDVNDIAEFELRQKRHEPWLYLEPEQLNDFNNVDTIE